MKNAIPTAYHIIIIGVIFLLSALFYFSPIEFQCKVCLPIGILTLSALVFLPSSFFLAMLFSVLGDYFGAIYVFPAQMGSFAIAHLFFIIYFYRQKVSCFTSIHLTTLYGRIITIFTFLLLTLVTIFILPHVSNIYLRIGTAIYTILILTMLWMALTMPNFLFKVGAILFVFSDSILAWNKFVCHIPNAWLLIMIPYYLGQFLLFCGAAKNKTNIINQ